MATFFYDSFIDDVYHNNINVFTDTFYGMLVTSAYTPNRGTDTKRSDVTNEVAGTGYVAGGNPCVLTTTKNTTLHREESVAAQQSWNPSTIANAAALIIYKHRGGASSADELVAYCDFGGNVSSSAGPFAVTFPSPLLATNLP